MVSKITKSSWKAVIKNVIDTIKSGTGDFWFLKLGNVFLKAAKFLESMALAVFGSSFVLSLAVWVISTYTFITRGNKNLGKTLKYIYGALCFLFAVATGAAFILFGLQVGMAMVIASMFIDPVVSLCAAIGFMLASLLAKNQEMRDYFGGYARKYGLRALIGGTISLAFLVLMLSPLVKLMPIGVRQAIGIAGMVVVTALSPPIRYILSRLWNWVSPALAPIINWIKSTSSQNSDISASEMLERVPFVRPTEVLVAGYFENTLNSQRKPASWEELNQQIDSHFKRVKRELDAEQPTAFWSQQVKRENKLKALQFISNLVEDAKNDAIPDSASETDPLLLSNQPFHYKDKNDLASQVYNHIKKTYPGAFQSFFKDVGGVQACFDRAFLYIIGDSLEDESDLELPGGLVP